MRILAPISDNLPFCQPGITAKIAWHNIVKHNKNQTQIQILQRITDKFDLDLKDVSFVHECLFAVTKDQGRELEFLDTWERIAAYCELNKFYRGEGHAIGLAAAKIGWRVSVDPMSEICFFKDKLELDKIKSGDTELQEINAFLETQKKLEYPQMSLLRKLINKSHKIIMYLYRSLRLKIFNFTDIDFYYK